MGLTSDRIALHRLEPPSSSVTVMKVSSDFISGQSSCTQTRHCVKSNSTRMNRLPSTTYMYLSGK